LPRRTHGWQTKRRRMKPPLPDNEVARLAALRDYRILDSAAESAYDDITKLAAYICRVPMATISFVDASRQWFKSRVGIADQETSRDIAFCAHTILGTEPMIVRDATEDQRFCDSSLVLEEPRIRFYAGFPLITSEGYSLGALCAIDRKPHQLDAEQQTAMRALSRQIMALLDLRRSSARLAELLEAVKTLEGLLPLCAWCKKVRDDTGYWNKLEAYLTSRTDVQLTHGICPDCLQKMWPRGQPAPGSDQESK
jgi:GAF domain-containing protein